ncbi:MAG TPA: TonB C-terminal domain-containing protein [Longimicrobiales bacterium]|nr:TonB C-terminal domain-containing protein [Longimicrobiales bacterium]
MDEHTTQPAEGASTWGERLRRRRPRPPRRALLGSVLLHLLVVALLWLAGVKLRPDLPEFLPYTVTLVSPPPAVAGEPEPVVTSTPVVAEAEPPPPEVTAQPPKPQPPRTQAPAQQPVERRPDATPAKGPDPKPVSVSGENMDVRIEGQEFPYPDYLADMIANLMRIFRWTGAPNLEAEVVFAIRRDGTVDRSISLVRRSGNFNFDMAAVEAVEQAGRTRAFDPLPEGLQGDRLWISFTFKPKKD